MIPPEGIERSPQALVRCHHRQIEKRERLEAFEEPLAFPGLERRVTPEQVADLDGEGRDVPPWRLARHFKSLF
jgi:hypothetical protein